jgi:hypothetical protein
MGREVRVNAESAVILRCFSAYGVEIGRGWAGDLLRQLAQLRCGCKLEARLSEGAS